MHFPNWTDGHDARNDQAFDLTRRSLLRRGLFGLLALSWGGWSDVGAQTGGSEEVSTENPDNGDGSEGVYDGKIVLGMSAAFSGPSRGLGSELYRGARSYFNHVNENGGVGGRQIVFKLYDDGYQPDPCVKNTMKLMVEDRVFLLFGYVGTPTVTRALPLLKKFQDERVYLFFPFTGAQPQREPPYGNFAFNLRASYRQGNRRTRGQFRSDGQKADRRCSTRPTLTAAVAGRALGQHLRCTANDLPARRPTAAGSGSQEA